MNNVFFEELDINFKGMTVFLDVDGTLLPDSQVDFSPAVVKNLKKLRDNNRVFLCTNSDDIIRNEKVAVILDLPVATYLHKKPSVKILRDTDAKIGDKNLLVIGDKILIDGLFSWNIGAAFIKTKRKISGRESLVVKLINFFDDIAWITVKTLKNI